MTEEEPTQKKPRFKPPQGTPRYILSDFKGLVPIEQGGGGLVSKGRLGDYGKIALKQFLYSEETQDKFKREIEILIERRHPNIIHLYGVLWDGLDASRYLGYVMEYLEGGSLKNIIYDPTNEYDRAQINRWIEQIARGIQFLHNYGIVHRDIKPDNILVAGEQLKLADFGVAKNVDGTTTAGRPYLELGNLSLYMLSAYIINGARPRIEWNKMNFDVAELIQKCWTPNPIYRPPIREVAEFFEGKSSLKASTAVSDAQERLSENFITKEEEIHGSLERQGKTIMIIGENDAGESGLIVWSSDQCKWVEINLELPFNCHGSGAVCLNGEMYFVGGLNSPKGLYKLDNTNGIWIQLADMNVYRPYLMRATVTWNGYIWVFGGQDGQECFKSVERYDPKEDKWTLMPDMKHERSFTSVVVWNNRFIVSGGYIGNNTRTNTTECFDPEEACWKELPDMPIDVIEHSLVSYDQKVVIVGGYMGEMNNSDVWELDPLEDELKWRPLPSIKDGCMVGIVFGGEIYALGGEHEEEGMTQVEIFDGKQWRLGPSLPYSIENGTQATIIPQSFVNILEEGEKQAANSLASDQSITIPMRQTPQANTILVIGRTQEGVNRLIVWNSDQSKWIETDIELPVDYMGSGTVYLNEDIYLVGGIESRKGLYKLDKNLNWLQLADMTVDRPITTRATVVFNGHIWVFGGQDENGNCLKSVERYDPKEDKWMSMPDMIHPRSAASVTVWDDLVITVTGGMCRRNPIDSAESFYPDEGVWDEEDMPTELGYHSMVSYNLKIILFGGAIKRPKGLLISSDVWELDPLEEEPEWRPLPRMKYPSATFAGIVFDGEIYAIGGCQAWRKGMTRVEIFDGEQWRLGPSLPRLLNDASALIIPQTLADRLCGLPYHSFDDFRGMKKIDNGGYGTVFIAYAALKGFTRKKQTVAIKCFNAINVYSEREIDILKTRTHPNIVQLFGVIWDGEFVDKNTPRKIPKYTGYVMEYMELGSLHRVIHDLSEEYDVELITTWIKQIATGLQYLHENGIIHRDVKPQNILLAARDHIKLADFGLARNNSAQNTNTYGLIGTGAYRAPEIVSSRDYGPSADIYSLGVTIWEIVTRQEPRGIFDMEGISNELSKLIKKCLKQKVSDRPSINEVIESVLPKTILLVNYRSMAVLSADRSKWTQLQLRIPIFAWRSIYLNEEIYIIGGDNDSSLYKLDKNLEWILLSDMNIGRMFITNSCLEWNGYIWIFGGRDNHFELLKSVERYDPKANKWTLMPDMIHPRVEAAATVWNDRIIVYGGLTRNDAGELYMTNTAECFNPKDGTWTELPSMPKPLCGLSLVSYKNKIIVMDVMKKEDESHSCVYELDLLEENPTWKPLPPMKYPAFFLGGIVFNDEIYAIGGRQLLDRKNEYRDRVEIFNGEQWRDGPQLPFRWSYGMSAIIIPQHLADRLCNYKPE